MGLPTGVEQKVAEPVKVEVVTPTAEPDVKPLVPPAETEPSLDVTTNSEPAESPEVMIIGIIDHWYWNVMKI